MQAKLIPACKNTDLSRYHTDFIFTFLLVRGFKEDLYCLTIQFALCSTTLLCFVLRKFQGLRS